VCATSASLSIVSSPCLWTSAVCVNQRIISYASCSQLYVHCPSTLRRRLSSRSCQHAWTTATVSCMLLLMDWCNSFKQSRMPLHVLITGARWRDHISPDLQQLHWLLVCQRVQFKLAVLVFKALHGQAPQCLTDDCQLVAAAGCRQLWSSEHRHMFSATDPQVPRRSCVWCCWTTSVERFADQLPSASPLPWDSSEGR